MGITSQLPRRQLPRETLLPRASRLWADRSFVRQSRCRKLSARSCPPCRLSGAALFRLSVRTQRSVPRTSTMRSGRQGEDTILELLDALQQRSETVESITGLSWRRGSQSVHNKDRKFSSASLNRMLPYDKLPNPRQYLVNTYLGRRTIGYQAALGCRFRCTFCGVASMFRGKMALPPAERLHEDLRFMRDRLGRRRHSILRSQFL